MSQEGELQKNSLSWAMSQGVDNLLIKTLGTLKLPKVGPMKNPDYVKSTTGESIHIDKFSSIFLPEDCTKARTHLEDTSKGYKSVKADGKTFTLTDIQNMIKIHKFKSRQEEINDLFTWLDKPLENPSPDCDSPNCKLIDDFKVWISSNALSDVIVGSDILTKDLILLCNDNLLELQTIMAFMPIINASNPKRKFFYLNLMLQMSEEDSESESQIFDSKVKEEFVDVEQIVFVAHVGKDGNKTYLANASVQGIHWALLTLDFIYGTSQYCDSLGWEVPQDLKKRIENLIIKISEVLNKNLLKPSEIFCAHQPGISGKKHACTNRWWVNYPNQRDSHICGVICIIMAAVFVKAPNYWGKVGVSTDGKASWLKNPSDHSSYLRKVLISWLMKGSTDMNNIFLMKDQVSNDVHIGGTNKATDRPAQEGSTTSVHRTSYSKKDSFEENGKEMNLPETTIRRIDKRKGEFKDRSSSETCQAIINKYNNANNAKYKPVDLLAVLRGQGSMEILVYRQEKTTTPAIENLLESQEKKTGSKFSYIFFVFAKSDNDKNNTETTEITDTINTSESTDTLKISESADTIKTSEITGTLKTSESADTIKTSESPDTIKTSESTDTIKTSESADTIKTSEITDTLKTTESTNTKETTGSTGTSNTRKSNIYCLTYGDAHNVIRGLEDTKFPRDVSKYAAKKEIRKFNVRNLRGSFYDVDLFCRIPMIPEPLDIKGPVKNFQGRVSETFRKRFEALEVATEKGARLEVSRNGVRFMKDLSMKEMCMLIKELDDDKVAKEDGGCEVMDYILEVEDQSTIDKLEDKMFNKILEYVIKSLSSEAANNNDGQSDPHPYDVMYKDLELHMRGKNFKLFLPYKEQTIVGEELGSFDDVVRALQKVLKDALLENRYLTFTFNEKTVKEKPTFVKCLHGNFGHNNPKYIINDGKFKREDGTEVENDLEQGLKTQLVAQILEDMTKDSLENWLQFHFSYKGSKLTEFSFGMRETIKTNAESYSDALKALKSHLLKKLQITFCAYKRRIKDRMLNYFHGEVVLDDKKEKSKIYNKVDGSWYEIEEQYNKLLLMSFQNMLSRKFKGDKRDNIHLPKVWQIGKKEDYYNQLYSDETDFYVADKITPLYIELCDIMKLTEDAIYLYHVKEGFGQSTRDACSQIRNSAAQLRGAQKQYLGEFYRLATHYKGNGQYRTNLKQKLLKFDKDRFLDFFQKKKVVFVYAFANKIVKKEGVRWPKDKMLSEFKDRNVEKFSMSTIARNELHDTNIHLETLGFDFAICQISRYELQGGKWQGNGKGGEEWEEKEEAEKSVKEEVEKSVKEEAEKNVKEEAVKVSRKKQRK